MPVTLEQVRAALAPEELDYNKTARELGEEALPHLERLIATAQPLLASKAAYMAGAIGSAGSVKAIERASRSADARVRIAAAHAVQNLPAESASDVLLSLVDDADVGVQKTALRSVPAEASAVLRARVEGLSRTASTNEVVRSRALEFLGADPAAAARAGASSKSRGGSKGAAKAGAKKAGAKKSGSKKGGSKKAAGGGKKASRGRQ